MLFKHPLWTWSAVCNPKYVALDPRQIWQIQHRLSFSFYLRLQHNLLAIVWLYLNRKASWCPFSGKAGQYQELYIMHWNYLQCVGNINELICHSVEWNSLMRYLSCQIWLERREKRNLKFSALSVQFLMSDQTGTAVSTFDVSWTSLWPPH